MKDSAHKDETAPAVDGFQNAIDAARFLDSLTPFTLGVCRDRDVLSFDPDRTHE